MIKSDFFSEENQKQRRERWLSEKNNPFAIKRVRDTPNRPWWEDDCYLAKEAKEAGRII